MSTVGTILETGIIGTHRWIQAAGGFYVKGLSCLHRSGVLFSRVQ